MAIFGEPAGAQVWPTLAGAEEVSTSDITLIECDRAFDRFLREGRFPESEALERRGEFGRILEGWNRWGLDQQVIDRARRSFPREPVRTLDAIHLATALAARWVVPNLAMLSLDHRIRMCASDLGFDVIPPSI